MKHTLVGVFVLHADALRAAQQLSEQGYGESVQVTEAGTTLPGATPHEAHDDHSLTTYLRSFFAELIGPNEAGRVHPYADTVRGGGALVRVAVDDPVAAEAARGVLRGAGAQRIDESWVAAEPPAPASTLGSSTGVPPGSAT
jgi:hypothetical protein